MLWNKKYLEHKINEFNNLENIFLKEGMLTNIPLHNAILTIEEHIETLIKKYNLFTD